VVFKTTVNPVVVLLVIPVIPIGDALILGIVRETKGKDNKLFNFSCVMLYADMPTTHGIEPL
jgi:hypothetical protein